MTGLREQLEAVCTELEVCVVCDQPVDPDDAHYSHWPGCRYPDVDCDCDLIVHADCCPDCTREAAG